MVEDGVDLTDERAVQEWIDRFNALTREDREQRVPALTQLPGPASPSASPGSTKRRSQAKAKKAQRQARRRNRRR